MSKRCDGFCAPTIVMMIMGAISTALSVLHPDAQSTQERIFAMIVTASSSVFWVAITYMLCSYCHEGWAWFLFLVPILLFFVLSVGLISLFLSLRRSAPAKEKFANYPFQGVSYQPPQSGDPVQVNSVCGYGNNPSSYLRPMGPSTTRSDLPPPVTPSSQPAASPY